MNICLITEEWPGENDYGGIGFHFLNEAKYFASLRHKIVIIFNGSTSPLNKSGYTIIGAGGYVKDLPIINTVLYNTFTKFVIKKFKQKYPELTNVTVWNILAVITFISLFNKHKFDIVETHDYHSSFLLLITGWFSHLVVTIQGWKKITLELNHDYIDFERKLLIANEMLFIRSVRNCYASSYVIKRLANLYFQKKISTVISNAIDTDFFTPKETNKNFILFVGRYERRKGIVQLIQAYQDLCKTLSIEKTPELYLVGGESHIFRIHNQECNFLELLNLTVTKDIIKKIRLIPYTSQEALKAYYGDCLFCVLPSIFEPFGNAVGEALSCGKVVITTKKTGAAESLHNKKNIIFVTLNKVAIKNAMVYILRNIDVRQLIEKNARRVAVTQFSIPIIGKKVITYYHEIMSHN